MQPCEWGPPPPHPVAPQPPARPRWWIAAAVGIPLGVVGALLLAATYFLFFLSIPVLLLALAVALTVCFVRAPRSPDALAVGLGFVVSVPVSVVVLAIAYAVLYRSVA